ncbi:class IV adenylate cyclase [Candidatus Saccharibacteria bacterium]|nr:class IV adenylate cyclase [Candidatus Saccharibacteria bacterium]
MAKEIEIKVLDIIPNQLRKLLLDAGAKQDQKLTKQMRYVFDIDPRDKSKWIRLRTIGTTTTLAVKVINSAEIDGTHEYETEVADPDNTLSILEQMGFQPKSYQENYRESYILNGASVSIDYWPKLKPYLEIEATDKAKIESVIKSLHLNQHKTTSENTKHLYLDIGIDLDKSERLVFNKDEEELIVRY